MEIVDEAGLELYPDEFFDFINSEPSVYATNFSFKYILNTESC